jgi:hypothetical protein
MDIIVSRDTVICLSFIFMSISDMFSPKAIIRKIVFNTINGRISKVLTLKKLQS